jgi:prepilin-type N-terminal cleavage/methylation domain-containing protein
MNDHGKKPGRAGFTLLEVLISVVLLSVIAVVIGGGMRLGYRAVAKGEKKIERLEMLEKSLAIMDEQVLSAVPLTFTNDDGTKHFYFEGHEHSLTVPTTYSIWSGRNRYVIVEYRVRTNADGTRSLWANERVVMTAVGKDVEMLHGLKDVRFEYFYEDPTEEEGDWVKEWDDEAGIPRKVRIRVVLDKREILLQIPLNARGDLTQTTTAGLPDGMLSRPALPCSHAEGRA